MKRLERGALPLLAAAGSSGTADAEYLLMLSQEVLVSLKHDGAAAANVAGIVWHSDAAPPRHDLKPIK